MARANGAWSTWRTTLVRKLAGRKMGCMSVRSQGHWLGTVSRAINSEALKASIVEHECCRLRGLYSGDRLGSRPGKARED